MTEKTARMKNVKARELKIGDKIMPPLREIQLWMQRNCERRGLAESALYLIVTSVEDARADKRGQWLRVRTRQTPEWCAEFVDPDPGKHPFSFRVRPETPWPVVETA